MVCGYRISQQSPNWYASSPWDTDLGTMVSSAVKWRPYICVLKSLWGLRDIRLVKQNASHKVRTQWNWCRSHHHHNRHHHCHHHHCHPHQSQEKKPPWPYLNNASFMFLGSDLFCWSSWVVLEPKISSEKFWHSNQIILELQLHCLSWAPLGGVHGEGGQGVSDAQLHLKTESD